MSKKVMEIKAESGTLEYLESLYYEYRAKQDIINSVFELHKFDEDGAVITGVPFRMYEKEFAEVKVSYDKALEEIRDMYIPKDVQDSGVRFEVDFENSIIRVTPLRGDM